MVRSSAARSEAQANVKVLPVFVRLFLLQMQRPVEMARRARQSDC
jgi:hypothetical protein